MGDVVRNFLNPMRLQFALPTLVKEGQEQAFYKDYVEALGEFGDDELAYAAKWMKTTRETRTLPVIADCLEACRHARKAIRASGYQPQPRREGDTRDDWLPHRVDTASKMICSEIGRRAAQEGWLLGLWDFCRKNERHPNSFEADKVKKDSLSTWAYVDEAIKEMNANGQDSRLAVQMRKSMRNRYRSLKEKVYANEEVV